MLRKIIEVCKKHWLIISDIVLLIISVVIPSHAGLDVRPFLIIPVILIYLDVYFLLFDKRRVWRSLLTLFLGMTMYFLLQGLF